MKTRRKKDWRINARLMKSMKFGPCEWCKRSGPTDPHHVPCRGMAGGSRLDTRLTLIALDGLCHAQAHAGRILRVDLEAVIAQREGCLTDDLRAAVAALLKLGRQPMDHQVEACLAGLNRAARDLAESVLAETLI